MTRSPKEKKGPASPNTINVQPKTKKKSGRPAGACSVPSEPPTLAIPVSLDRRDGDADRDSGQADGDDKSAIRRTRARRNLPANTAADATGAAVGRAPEPERQSRNPQPTGVRQSELKEKVNSFLF